MYGHWHFVMSTLLRATSRHLRASGAGWFWSAAVMQLRPCILKHMQERLQRYLARCGVASRRHAERLITQGRVTVNGKTITELGSKVSPELDTVLVDGRNVAPPAASTYLALHKPTGFLTTRSDPHGRRTVYDLLPANCAHLAPVGRLDYRSEGLLLFTDDGAWANRVTHPRYGGEKQYNVLVYGTLTAQQRAALRAPMTIDGYRLKPVAVRMMDRKGEGTWVSLTLTEGRKRQIRQMLAAIGKHAARLIRIRIGPVSLGNLGPGQLRPLTEAEIEHWRESPQSPDPERKAFAPAPHRRGESPATSMVRGSNDPSLVSDAVGTPNRDQN